VSLAQDTEQASLETTKKRREIARVMHHSIINDTTGQLQLRRILNIVAIDSQLLIQTLPEGYPPDPL
jgi:hypothetical protein